jgi:hypothetical protein
MDGMQLLPSIGQRPAWRLGCFALTDVRYQLLLFFARVYFCNVLCYKHLFHMLDMVSQEDHACGFITVATVTMVIITRLCSSKIMIVLPQVLNRSGHTAPP